MPARGRGRGRGGIRGRGGSRGGIRGRGASRGGRRGGRGRFGASNRSRSRSRSLSPRRDSLTLENGPSESGPSMDNVKSFFMQQVSFEQHYKGQQENRDKYAAAMAVIMKNGVNIVQSKYTQNIVYQKYYRFTFFC